MIADADTQSAPAPQQEAEYPGTSADEAEACVDSALIEVDDLVEDVSIDGMCGVY